MVSPRMIRRRFAAVALLAAAVLVSAGPAEAKIEVTITPVATAAPWRAEAMVGIVNGPDGRPILLVAGGRDDAGAPVDRIDGVRLVDPASGDPARGTVVQGTLPLPVARGASAVADNQLWCIGGEGAADAVRRVFGIAVVAGEDGPRLTVREHAALPAGHAPLAAAMMDGRLHCLAAVAPPTDAGAAPKLVLLALDPSAPDAAWQVVDETDQPLLHPTAGDTGRYRAVVRYDDRSQRSVLHVLGGSGDASEGDLHARWQSRASIGSGWAPRATPHAALRSAVPFGASHILAQTDQGLLLYHTFTDTWVPLLGGAEQERGRLLVGPDGAAFRYRPTADGAMVERLSLASALPGFGWVNLSVVVVYLLSLMWIGGYFAKREKTTEDYFLGGRRVPWWAAGISIYATGVSAISFMAIPAKTYATDWTYISQGILPPIVTFIAAYLFVPMLRRLNITTVMEYKGLRFGPSLRYAASFLLIAAQIGGRMSVVLLLPAIALSAVMGIDTITAVLLMGVIATAYTVLGGIHAVIWTDVLQVVVMFGGAILSLAIIAWGVDGGPAEALRVADDFAKFRSFDFTWDFTTATVWIFTIWGIADLFNRVGQESMQRAFATKGIKEARRSLITCALISVPGTLIFYALGSALFAHYHGRPEELDPTLATDAVFPLFIATNLPIGVAGVVIAGLFAASMSTLDSGMNAVATVFVTDFYRLFRRDAPERTRLRMARWITVLSGAAGTGMAVGLAALNQRSLWDTFTIIMGLIGGGFGGVMVLGMMTRRANTIGTWIGVLAGTGAVAAVKFYTPVSFFIYGAIGMAVCIIVGYLASLATGGETKDLTGLTIWTPRPNPDAGDRV